MLDPVKVKTKITYICYWAQVWFQLSNITLCLCFVMVKMLLTWTCERALEPSKGKKWKVDLLLEREAVFINWFDSTVTF